MSTPAADQADSAPTEHAPTDTPSSPLLAFGVWQMLTAGWSALAAIASFQEIRGAGLLFGGMALACVLTALGMKQVPLRWWQPLPYRLISVAAMAVHALIFGLLVQGVSSKLGVMPLLAGWVIRPHGFLLATVAVAAAWVGVFAFWTWRWLRGGRLASVRTLVLWLPVAAMAGIAMGPSFELHNGRSDRTWIKRSLQDAAQKPWGRQVRLAVHDTDEFDGQGQRRRVSCIESEQRHLAWLSVISATSAPELDDDAAPAARWARCERESEAALQSGEAIEAALLKGNVSGYLRQVTAAHLADPIGLTPERLPQTLQAQLTRWLPQDVRQAPTVYDLAIATQQTDFVTRHLPGEDDVKPHQRQALFQLGQARLIEHLPGKTPESIEADRQAHREQILGMAQHLGGSIWANPMLYAALGAGESRAGFTGGFTAFDYFYANRHCDLPYARYLKSRDISPQVEHAQHLLSLLAFAQHGSSPFFKFADDSLGEPNEGDLAACRELATWYGEQVRYQNAEDFEGAYDHMTGLMQARPTPPLLGGAELVPSVLAALMRAQAPSTAHRCAWVNATFWPLVDPTENVPPLHDALLKLSPMLRAQPSTRAASGAAAVDPATDASAPCLLNQMAYSSDPQTLSRLNRRLKELGLPCQGEPHRNPDLPRLPVLRCQPG